MKKNIYELLVYLKFNQRVRFKKKIYFLWQWFF